MLNSAQSALMHPTVEKNALQVCGQPAIARLSDRQIIQQITQKDKVVFSLLYDKYAASLSGILTRLNLDDELAALTIKRVFKHIWNHPADFDQSNGRLFTWLLHLTKREVFMILEENNNFINKHISSFSRLEHCCFDLVYIYGFTSGQISLVIKIPEDQIKKILDKIMEKLSK